MNTLAQRLLFTTSGSGKTLVSEITRKNTSQVKDEFVPTLTPAAELLLKQANTGGLEIQEPTVIARDTETTSEAYFQAGQNFIDLFRLDNSKDDLNPALGQVEIHVPSGGYGRTREHYLIANFGGTRSNGWLEQYKDYPAVESMPARELREYQQIKDGRAEVLSLEISPNGESMTLSQNIADLSNPDDSHMTRWYLR